MTWRPHHLLGLSLRLTLLLGTINLGAVGYGNGYFAGALWSMTQSLDAFLFAGLDPAGYVTVDKPPLGFWIQALSVTLFGDGSYALLLPTVLAGTLSAYLLHRILTPTFGPWVGSLGALLMGTAPITIVVSRHNTHDAFVVLFLLLAAVCLLRGRRTGALWPFVAAGGLIGGAFNIKMGLALVALPGFALYAMASPHPPLKRTLKESLALGLSLLVIGASWIVFVDATPPENRPYVGGSDNNTAFNLLIQKNTLRALPSLSEEPKHQNAGRPPGPRPPRADDRGDGPPPNHSGDNRPPPDNQDVREVGTPGPLRLMNRQLAGQIAWLLPLALLGFLGAVKEGRDRDHAFRAHAFLWGGWMVPLLLLFTVTPRFHRHYLILLAPPLAALGAIGLKRLMTATPRGVALGGIGSVVVVCIIIWPFPTFRPLLILPLVSTALLAFGLRSSPKAPQLRAVAMAILYVPSLVWGAVPIVTGGDADLPFAGPELLERRSISAPPSQMAPFKDFIASDGPGSRFFVGTWDGRTAGHLMMATGEPVMAIGGYNGKDRILDGAELGEWIRLGEVRHFLVGPPPKGQEENHRTIEGRCEVVEREKWLPESAHNGARGGPPKHLKLYRCP